jgi:hypothetical protein
MTTELNNKIGLIDSAYPVAGQDNDSQGFRDNFTNIKQSLQLASAEILEVQSKAVLKSDLTTNNPVVNDLAGSSIINGKFNKFYATAYTPTSPTTSGTDILVDNGSFQSFTLGTDVQFTFRNWPITGQYGVIRVLLVSDNASITRTVTFASAQGTIRYGNSGIDQNGWPATFTVPALFTRATTASSPVAATSITVSDVSNLRVGNAVVYTPFGGVTDGGVSTIAAININTKVVTLTTPVTTGDINNGDLVKFRYTGPRVIEAFTFDGGTNVYIRQVADY